MIHKAILVLTTILAVVTGGVWGGLACRNVKYGQELVIRISRSSAPEVYVGAGASLGWYDFSCRLHVPSSETSRRLPVCYVRRFGITIEETRAAGAPTSSSVTSIRFHLAYPLVAFGAYPLIALFRGRLNRRRRMRAGQCIKCGYNLEGNESGVCPECGVAR